MPRTCKGKEWALRKGGRGGAEDGVWIVDGGWMVDGGAWMECGLWMDGWIPSGLRMDVQRGALRGWMMRTSECAAELEPKASELMPRSVSTNRTLRWVKLSVAPA
jgi:hypothetical protein